MSLSLKVAFIFFYFASITGHAQESVTQETNAPYIKWYQINTPNFRILYPKDFEVQAQRVANTLETIREPEAATMGVLPKKITVILQNQSSLSNGFVTLAPRRSEFYTMPPQNYNFIGTNDWMNNLASHEYRHMVQFQRSITGFNKLIYYVFGQQATAGMAFAAAPQWFWEGDAVATETAFTPSGRGRIPNFDLVFRTNIMEGRTFNYHKQYLRSYKHNIPNHYVLGYNMISYLRKKTGDPLVWEKIVKRSWDVPFIPFAFSNAIKKETGLHVTNLYNEMAAERKKDYEAAVTGLKFNTFETVTKRKSNAYTDYLYPQPLDDGSVLVVKSGIGDIETLVKISPEGKELSRRVQGVVNDAGMLSASNQRVVWNEYHFDPRWQVHTYSVIKGYDFGRKEAKRISNDSRYAAAALSGDGYKIATIESSHEYKTKVLIFDYLSGDLLQEIAGPENEMLSMPRWTQDGKSLVMLRTGADGKTITSLNTETGVYTNLREYSQENIGSPVPFDKYILFNSPVSGIDNIYAINIDTKERFQVTESKYGAYNPAVTKDGKTLYYNEQTRDGMDVVKMPFDPAGWKKPDPAPQPASTFYQHLVDEEGRPDLLKGITKTNFESKRYHRISGMINPHSWGPYFINSLTRFQFGITSQDVLSTTTISAGYIFDINERTGMWQAAASYQGFLPIIDVKVSQADRSNNEGDVSVLVITGTDSAIVKRNLTFTWEEKTLETGLRIPLVTTTSRFIGNFTIGNSVGVTKVSDFRNSISGANRIVPAVIKNDTLYAYYPFFSYVGNGNLVFNHFSLSAYRLMKQSRRDINSKWGQQFFLDLYNTPYGGSYHGSQFSFYGIAYFPGLFKHHSTWGYWAYQRSQLTRVNFNTGEGLDNYIFRSQIPLPRGQTVYRGENMYSMSINYTLPVWYPDAAVGPLLNIQRVRVNGFMDYAFASSPSFATQDYTAQQSYTSVGAEIKFDINVLRFLPQFNVGFRIAHGIRPATNTFEVLIGSFNF